MTAAQIAELRSAIGALANQRLPLRPIPATMVARLLDERERLIAALRPFAAPGTDSMTYRKLMAEWGMRDVVKQTDDAREALAFAEESAP